MKPLPNALALTLTVLVCAPLHASDSTDADFLDESPRPKAANPVSELRNQDSAFSLLLEAFRQVQSHLIESDYRARLEAAESLTDLKARRRVIVLAREERDLRMKKLYGQLGNLAISYEHAHALDERAAGIEVPMQLDTVAAAESLKSFVFIAPTPPDATGYVSTRTIPASAILSDQPAGESVPETSALDEQFHELFVHAR